MKKIKNNRLILFVCMFSCVSCQRSGYFEGLDRAISDMNCYTNSIKLKDMTDFEWDWVYFIQPYQSFDASVYIKDLTRKATTATRGQEYLDRSGVLLLFTKDNEFVKYTFISERTFKLMGLANRSDWMNVDTFRYGSDLIVPYLGE